MAGFIAYIECTAPCCTETEGNVATPNYGYEKRQKELAKKRKKEDKLKAKSERKTGEGGFTDGEPDDEGGAPATPAGDTPAQP